MFEREARVKFSNSLSVHLSVAIRVWVSCDMNEWYKWFQLAFLWNNEKAGPFIFSRFALEHHVHTTKIFGYVSTTFRMERLGTPLWKIISSTVCLPSQKGRILRRCLRTRWGDRAYASSRRTCVWARVGYSKYSLNRVSDRRTVSSSSGLWSYNV